MPTVVHVSPHPDDECLGAPCTLLALQEAGWRVVDFAAGFGRPDQIDRRRAERAAAIRVAGFEPVESAARPGLSARDDLDGARRVLAGELRDVLRDVDLVVGPHPRDGHHGHVAVAGAIRDVVAATGLTWWMWSIWADLPRPTLLVDCPPRHRRTSAAMLEHHAGELARNDYRALQDPRRRVDAVRGAERVFGYGSRQQGAHAELLTEVTAQDGVWMLGRPRLLDPTGVGTTWSPLVDLAIVNGSC